MIILYESFIVGIITLIIGIITFNLIVNKFNNDIKNLKAIKLSFFITGCAIYLIYKFI
jgi:hypothetical protein